MHQPKLEEQNIQINMLMQPPKANLGGDKSNNRGGGYSGSKYDQDHNDEYDDDENVDDSYQHHTVDEMQNLQRSSRGNANSKERNMGGKRGGANDSEPDSGVSPRLSKVP